METTRTTSSTEESEHNENGRTTSASSETPRQATCSRGPEDLRRALNLIATLLVGVLLVVAITQTDDTDTSAAGRGEHPANSQRSSDSTEHRYKPRDAHTDRGTVSRGQPLNQPSPVPSYRWEGWNRYRDGRCAWLPAGLLDSLAPVGTPRPTSTSCIVSLGDGTTIRITWGPPQSAARWAIEGGHVTTGDASDGSRRAEVTTIAGLEARATRPFFLLIFLPGLCRIDLNTGSVTGLSIFTWHSGARADRCHTAKTAATLISRARVPAAGGTPWNDTPQQPTVASLTGRGPCELLNASITRLNGLDDLDTGRMSISNSDDTDAECELPQAGGQVRAWLTSTSDTTTNAHDNPAGRNADGRPRQLGPLRAFEKSSSKSCVVEAELLPDYTWGVERRSV
jgi:hypothetical protein